MVAVGTGHGATALAGALGLSGLYLVVHLAAPAALGAGDVKLALGCGALTGALGTEVWVLAAVGAPLLTAEAGCSLRSGAGALFRTVRRCAR